MKEEILTLKEALAKAVDELQQMEVPDADIDAWYLLSYVTGLDRAAFFLHGEEPMAEPDMIRYRDLVTKRGERIPLQHLTGEQEFMGLAFHVNEHVLIPRQDTECLVERVLPYVDGKRVLDVCTGSGCIAIAIAKLGKPFIVHGVDISEEALAVARQNATELNASVDGWAIRCDRIESTVYPTVSDRGIDAGSTIARTDACTGRWTGWAGILPEDCRTGGHTTGTKRKTVFGDRM